jgi:hypothetical protein
MIADEGSPQPASERTNLQQVGNLLRFVADVKEAQWGWAQPTPPS